MLLSLGWGRVLVGWGRVLVGWGPELARDRVLVGVGWAPRCRPGLPALDPHGDNRCLENRDHLGKKCEEGRSLHQTQIYTGFLRSICTGFACQYNTRPCHAEQNNKTKTRLTKFDGTTLQISKQHTAHDPHTNLNHITKSVTTRPPKTTAGDIVHRDESTPQNPQRISHPAHTHDVYHSEPPSHIYLAYQSSPPTSISPDAHTNRQQLKWARRETVRIKILFSVTLSCIGHFLPTTTEPPASQTIVSPLHRRQEVVSGHLYNARQREGGRVTGIRHPQYGGARTDANFQHIGIHLSVVKKIRRLKIDGGVPINLPPRTDPIGIRNLRPMRRHMHK